MGLKYEDFFKHNINDLHFLMVYLCAWEHLSVDVCGVRGHP